MTSDGTTLMLPDQEAKDSQSSLEGEVVPSQEARVVKCFAIIGTREPDKAQAEVAYRLAGAIVWLGNSKIRTGAAYGIDQKAMEGTQGRNLEVFLPWPSYNRDIIPAQATRVVYDPNVHTTWTDSVTHYHPASSRLSRGAFALHARNFGIIEGTVGVIALPGPDGGGGTGQGIRIARALNIPVIQGNKGSINDVPRFIGKALQQLGLVSPDLKSTILGSHI